MKDPTELDPNEWIAWLRRRHGLESDTPYRQNPSHLDDFIRRIPEGERENARQVWRARQTQTAVAVYEELVRTYCHELVVGLDETERHAFEGVTFAVLPTHDFSGYTAPSPRGDRLIILHETIGYTINFWSYWYLRLFEDGNDFLLDVNRLVAAVGHLVDVWSGRPRVGPLPDVYPRRSDSWALAERLTMSSIVFVLGHELGHNIEGHAGYTLDRARNHEMEFAADRIGLRIAFRYAIRKAVALKEDNYYMKFALMGPLFFLWIASLLEPAESETHPSPLARANRMLPELRITADEVFGADAKRALGKIDDDLDGLLRFNNHGLNRLGAVIRPMVQEFLEPSMTAEWTLGTSWLRR